MRDPPQGVTDPTYLGDGVYAGTDGYHVVLWLEGPSAFGAGVIALEPGVLRALDRYKERVRGGGD